MGNNSHPAGAPRPRLVGAVFSPATLASATRLRRPPDLFELRLDALRRSLGQVEAALPRLKAPLLLTARHPAEGGRGQLSLDARRALLGRFLPHAAAIDLELRSVRQMRGVIAEARQRRLEMIISAHHLEDTPSPNELRREAEAAMAAGASLFKLATRTDTPEQVARLRAFFESVRYRFPVAVMGFGRAGRQSRLLFDRLGSALTYVSLGAAVVAGQISLSQLRRNRRAYIE